jgi:diaminohydroxyphosphoribosylaminopyrimidine deaminase/5-amino-6-(5-phosphoribosylamino)uracil reductase
MKNDRAYMEIALREAERGLGLTSPNPPVGAVIVSEGGEVISTGYHRRAGGPHAEIEAIRRCRGEGLRGATLYITLEPCSSHGRTPPCTQAIISAGIRRVVYATTDPNPAHAGRADRILRRHGIELRRGVLRSEAQRLIRPWAHWILTGRPWVIAKAGTSLDGRITRPPGEPQWLTNPDARRDAQQLRRRVDAILIGAGTLRADDPSLSVRGAAARGKLQPHRIVLAGKRRINRSAQIFTDRHSERTRVFRDQELGEVIDQLGRLGITSVLIEGGGQVLGAAFASGLVDEAHFYIAPMLCGNAATASIALPLSESVQLGETQILSIGDNAKISGIVQ